MKKDKVEPLPKLHIVYVAFRKDAGVRDRLRMAVKVEGLDGEALVTWVPEGSGKRVMIRSEGDYVLTWPIKGQAGIALKFELEAEVHSNRSVIKFAAENEPRARWSANRIDVPKEAKALLRRASHQIIMGFRDNKVVNIVETRAAIAHWKQTSSLTNDPRNAAVKLAWKKVKQTVRQEDRAILMTMPTKDERIVILEVLAKLALEREAAKTRRA